MPLIRQEEVRAEIDRSLRQKSILLREFASILLLHGDRSRVELIRQQLHSTDTSKAYWKGYLAGLQTIGNELHAGELQMFSHIALNPPTTNQREFERQYARGYCRANIEATLGTSNIFSPPELDAR